MGLNSPFLKQKFYRDTTPTVTETKIEKVAKPEIETDSEKKRK